MAIGLIKPAPYYRLAADTPLANGLIGAWLFNAGYGASIADRLGLGYELTATNTTWGAGRNGGSACVWNGTTSVVTSTSYLSVPTNVTVAAWVMLTGAGENNGGMILTWGNDSTSPAFRLQTGNGANVISSLNLVTDGSATCTDVITTGVWTHIATTVSTSWSPVVPKVYVNGIALAASTAVNGSGAYQNNGTYLYVGNRSGTDRTFAGAIDSVFIWSRVLTGAEILQHYMDSYGMFTPPMINSLWMGWEAGTTPPASAKRRLKLGFPGWRL